MDLLLADVLGRHLTLGEENAGNLSNYVRISDHPSLPHWWKERGNEMYFPADMAVGDLPNVLPHPGLPLPEGCCLLVNGKSDFSVMLWGQGSLLYVAPDARLNGSIFELGCGYIYVGPQVRVTARLKLNCRNGGRIHLEKDILVAGDVQIFTDDCHSIVDYETGKRVNPFGGSVFVGEHVWIGQEALIFGNSEIGDFTVVGARSVVRGIFKNTHQVIAGTPARTVSDGVNWSELDLP